LPAGMRKTPQLPHLECGSCAFCESGMPRYNVTYC
jgi:hypothetical protein